MRILFYRYGSICEEDVLDCFKESGHTVTQITDEITNKNVTFVESAKLVAKVLDESTQDCVFSINFYPAISDVCNIYHIRYICWVVDSPVLELFAKSIQNPWNRIFVFDRAQYNDIVYYNPSCIFHYPLAVNVAGKQNAIKSATAEMIKKYSHDVSFVGSFYTEKCPYDKLTGESEYLKGYMKGLIEAQLKVYGFYFVQDALTEDVIKEFVECMPDYYRYPLEGFLTDRETISQYYIGNKIAAVERTKIMELLTRSMDVDVYTGSDTSEFSSRLINHGFANTLTEMPIIFNRSKINLNPTSKAIRSGVPLRIFDVMACEGFVLSNYQAEMAELFVPGEDFVFYESIEQIPELIDYYLSHDAERRDIAHNGFVKVKDEYNYMLRLNKLLVAAFEV